MPKRPHTVLHCSPNGPWITLRAGERSLTFNLRHLVRELMPAQYADRRRTMAQWLKDREAEGKEEPVNPPPPMKVGERRQPSKPMIPASRRIPPRTLKRPSD